MINTVHTCRMLNLLTYSSKPHLYLMIILYILSKYYNFRKVFCICQIFLSFGAPFLQLSLSFLHARFIWRRLAMHQESGCGIHVGRMHNICIITFSLVISASTKWPTWWCWAAGVGVGRCVASRWRLCRHKYFRSVSFESALGCHISIMLPLLPKKKVRKPLQRTALTMLIYVQHYFCVFACDANWIRLMGRRCSGQVVCRWGVDYSVNVQTQ